MFLFLFILSVVSMLGFGQESSRCYGKGNIVLMVPGNGYDNDPLVFRHVEEFLIKLINYMEIQAPFYNVGIILYGKSPVVLSEIRPFLNRTVLNTRLTLMSHQADYAEKLQGETNLPSALRLMQSMFKRANRLRSPSGGILKNIGILLSNDTKIQETESIKLANASKRAGTLMYVVSSASADFFIASLLASDGCKVFYVNNFQQNISRLLPRIGNNICIASVDKIAHLSKPGVNGKCKQILLYNPPSLYTEVICTDPEGVYPDYQNCAYFHKCYRGVPRRVRCLQDTVFDFKTRACSHKESVSCYSQIFCPTPTGLFPYRGNCGKFLNCYMGLPHVQDCPSGLIFDSKFKQCLRPGETYCPYS